MVLDRFRLEPDELLQFIQFQCGLWCTARARSSSNLTDEYSRNIESTIWLYSAVTRATDEEITERVGHLGGYLKPILKVILPKWLDEQRELAESSLKSWMVPSLTGLPVPFATLERDIIEFCDWLEQQGLLQLYWHFKRLADLGFDDGQIARSATAAEAVSYTNTVELLVNAVIRNRPGCQSPRGGTLAPKVFNIIDAVAPDLANLLKKFLRLTNTKKSTLRRRLAQISHIKQGGPHAPVLRVLLKLIVIRNEGSHLGLSGFDRSAIYDLLEALVQASLLLWKAR